MHVLDLLMLRQKASDFHCIFRVCPHPPWQCAHPPQNQPAIERRGDCTAAILNAANALVELGVDLCDDNSTSHVAVAAEIFCRGMQNQVGAEIERALQHRSPCIIENAEHSDVVKDMRDRCNDDDLQERI